MKNFKTSILMIMCFVLVFKTPAAATTLKGKLFQENFTVGNCHISSMTVAYSFGLLLGEPTVDGTFKWEAGPGTPEKCIDPQTSIFVKVISNNITGYIELRPAIPDAGSGFGFSTTGSPDWKKFILKTQPPAEAYHTAAIAKSFYKTGFVVESFIVAGHGKRIIAKKDKPRPKKEKSIRKKDSFWDFQPDKKNPSKPKDDFWSVVNATPSKQPDKSKKPVKPKKIVKSNHKAKKPIADSKISAPIKLTDGFWGCKQKNAWNQTMYYDLKFLENGRCFRYIRTYPTSSNCKPIGQSETYSSYPYTVKGKNVTLAGFKTWIPAQHLIFTGKNLIVQSGQDIESDTALKHFSKLQTPCGCRIKENEKASKAFCN